MDRLIYSMRAEAAERPDEGMRSYRLLVLWVLMLAIAALGAILIAPASAGTGTTAGDSTSKGNQPDAPNCDPNWQVVFAPNAGLLSSLRAVDGVSTVNMWAVGDYLDSSSRDHTLIQRWNGSAWSINPSPDVGTSDNGLTGVTALASNNAWAVGYYRDGNNNFKTLTLRWNGTTWSAVSSPNAGTSNNLLKGISAVSATDIWTAGYYDAAGGTRTLLLHWNGTTWGGLLGPNVGTGNNYLRAVTAVANNDVWAVGEYASGSTYLTLIEHWNGSTWSVVSSPNLGSNDHLSSVTATSANDVWAVGYYYDNVSARTETLVLHWNGLVWNVVPSANSTGNNYLEGVTAVAADDAWAVGHHRPTTVEQTLVLHWNGSTWSIKTSPNASTHDNQLYAVAAGSASDIWAVGDYIDPGDPRPLVERYNPCATSTSTPTRTPTSTVTPGGQATATPTACPIQFTDVANGSTFYDFVRCMACRGIINGYSSGCETGNPCFRPNSDVTRGQLSKIVANAAGFIDPVGSQQYEDVAPGSTFYDFVWRLSDRGYVSGYACGGAGEPCGASNLPYFRPNGNASRGQISKIVSNAAQFSDPPGNQLFEDVAPGSTFYDFIQRLANQGVMAGYPCGGANEPCGAGNLAYFRPGNNATRGQTSKIVGNTFFPGCVTP